jgi:Xaa-Pro aminopeptidase
MARPSVRPKSPHAARLDRVRRAFKTNKVDALLVNYPPDIRHLTGFIGEDAALLIERERLTLVTDGRFQEQVAIEAPGVPAIIRKDAMSKALAALIGPSRITRLGFDSGRMTVSALDELQTTLGNRRDRKASPVEYVKLPGFMGRQRAVKDATEVQTIRHAIDVAQQSMLALLPQIKVGMTESHAAGLLLLEMRQRGASDASFEPIVASGPHSSLPHYRAAMTPIAANAPLLIDWGALVDGYCSDLTRTFFIGKVSTRLEYAYEVVLDAQMTAIRKLKPGMTCHDADATARKVIEKARLGKRFSHSLGHGIGRDIHEMPRLAKKQNKAELEVGMVVTVEPGVYLPGLGGIRIEDDVLITRKGCEVLSSIEKSLSYAKRTIAV